MSDEKGTRMSSFQRLLSALVEPSAQMDIKALESMTSRLSEVEARMDYTQAAQEKNESDIKGIGITTALLLKTILRLTLQMQILYDRLGLDMQEEISRATGDSHSRDDDDEPGDSGPIGGMGGMLN